MFLQNETEGLLFLPTTKGIFIALWNDWNILYANISGL